MATVQLSKVLHQFRQTVLARSLADVSDAHLLERFVISQDAGAFEALLWRHGPMVLAVCRGILRDHHDAEDALQAVFLVLARKAASVTPRHALVSWLYGVAYRTALKARALKAKRRRRERQAMSTRTHEATPAAYPGWDELSPALEEELNRLPEKYRSPLILCDLEEKTRKEAAVQLGWPEGTVSGRLARARKLLADRLSRRGVVLSVGLPAVLLTWQTASAGLRPELVVTTTNAAILFAAGQAATGLVSAQVVALTEEILRAMFMTKVKIVTVLLLTTALFFSGVGAFLVPSAAADQLVPVPAIQGDENNQKDDRQQNQKDDSQKNQNDDGEKNQNDDGQKNQNNNGQSNQKDDGQVNQVVLKSIDLTKKSITVSTPGQSKTPDRDYTLPKGVIVEVGGKGAKLSDLKPGMKINLKLSKDKKDVVEIKEEAAKNRINSTNGNQNQNQNQKGNGENNQKNDGQKNDKNNGNNGK